MEGCNGFYQFETNECRDMIGRIVNNAKNLYDTLVMNKFDTDSIYTHVRWYLMGAKDVLIYDDRVTETDFDAATKVFSDFIDYVKKNINYD